MKKNFSDNSHIIFGLNNSKEIFKSGKNKAAIHLFVKRWFGH